MTTGSAVVVRAGHRGPAAACGATHSGACAATGRRWSAWSFIAIFVFVAVFAPVLAPYDPSAGNLVDSKMRHRARAT